MSKLIVSDKHGISDSNSLYSVENADTLVVALHAFTGSPSNLQRVAEVAREEYPLSDIYVPLLPASNPLSWADPDEIANGVLNFIDGLKGIGHYKRIIFIGHSFGAVMARKVWAMAHGAATAIGGGNAAPKAWATKIERIILFAAMNRGWQISSALNPLDRIVWTLGTLIGNIYRYVLGREHLIFAIRRGAPFLTTLRLQCLHLNAKLGSSLPITVQMLGTADDFVAPTDNLDLATGNSFFYVEVADAKHDDIVELKDRSANGTEARFKLALSGELHELQKVSLTTDEVQDIYDEETNDYDAITKPAEADVVHHAVFVTHGIRDRGFWTRRIAREVKSLARSEGQICRTVTSTYGYFPMGSFLLPWSRRAKVEWLLDQYVVARSLYPAAQYSFIGHSNGTYLLAKALELCPLVGFKNVIFAGSVVSCGYDWGRAIAANQVTTVLNYKATNDKVVAIFPYGLEKMRLQDVGGAGHRGFKNHGAKVYNFEFVEGGHGAALSRQRWSEMAEFVLGGNVPPPASPQPRQSWLTNALGFIAPGIWFFIVTAVLGAGYWLLGATGSVFWTTAFLIYLLFVSRVLTRA